MSAGAIQLTQQARKLDRRTFDRFAIERDVTYTILDNRNGHKVGVGKTVNMSSKGVRFSTEHFLVPGAGLELEINWPAQDEGKSPGKLMAHGRVIGCINGTASMEIQNFEFHEWSLA